MSAGWVLNERTKMTEGRHRLPRSGGVYTRERALTTVPSIRHRMTVNLVLCGGYYADGYHLDSCWTPTVAANLRDGFQSCSGPAPGPDCQQEPCPLFRGHGSQNHYARLTTG